MRILISLCVHGENTKRILAYMENARKESVRTWRRSIKNLCLQGECAKRIYAYMENAGKESMLTWRKHKIIIVNNVIT
jgi:hypothetical protein